MRTMEQFSVRPYIIGQISPRNLIFPTLLTYASGSRVSYNCPFVLSEHLDRPGEHYWKVGPQGQRWLCFLSWQPVFPFVSPEWRNRSQHQHQVLTSALVLDKQSFDMESIYRNVGSVRLQYLLVKNFNSKSKVVIDARQTQSFAVKKNNFENIVNMVYANR